MRNLLTLRNALIASLTLSAVLIGVIAGGLLGRHHGPWEKCLPPEAKNLAHPEFRVIRRQLAGAFAGSHEYRAKLRKQHLALQDLLRTDPLDPAELKTALEQLHVLEGEARVYIYEGLAETLSRMPPEHRLHVLRQLRITPYGRGDRYRPHKHRHHWENGHREHERPDGSPDQGKDIEDSQG